MHVPYMIGGTPLIAKAFLKYLTTVEDLSESDEMSQLEETMNDSNAIEEEDGFEFVMDELDLEEEFDLEEFIREEEEQYKAAEEVDTDAGTCSS